MKGVVKVTVAHQCAYQFTTIINALLVTAAKPELWWKIRRQSSV